MKNTVDVESVRKSLVEGLSLPRYFEELAAWLATRERGSLGYFDGIMGDADVAVGFAETERERVRATVSPFLRLGDGSWVAFWKVGRSATPAIVVIDSEGGHETLASNLDSFLIAWSKQACGVSDLDANDDDDDVAREHAELAKWLAKKRVRPAKEKAIPDLVGWLEGDKKTSIPALDRVALGKPPPGDARRLDDVTSWLALLGRSEKDPALLERLASLGITEVPRIPRSSTDARVDVGDDAHATLNFGASELYAALAPDGRSVFAQISVRPPRYTGPLPFDLSQGDSRAQLRGRFGEPLATNVTFHWDEWKVGDRNLVVGFHDDDASVQYVVIKVPRSP